MVFFTGKNEKQKSRFWATIISLARKAYIRWAIYHL